MRALEEEHSGQNLQLWRTTNNSFTNPRLVAAIALTGRGYGECIQFKELFSSESELPLEGRITISATQEVITLLDTISQQPEIQAVLQEGSNGITDVGMTELVSTVVDRVLAN